MSHHDQPQLLGEGSYGCVFSPAIPCSTPAQRVSRVKLPKGTQTISKVFVDTAHFNKELHLAKTAVDIDKDGRTLMLPTGYCMTKRGELMRHPAAAECSLVDDDYRMNPNTRYYQITMPYGGARFDHHIRDVPTTPQEFLHMLIPIIDGLVSLEAKKYCHQDIKGGNVLVTPKGRGIIIDYSLMIPFSKIYAPQNRRRLQYSYYPYPPEYKVFHYIVDSLCMDPPCNVLPEVMRNIDSFGEKRSAAFTAFINARTLRKQVNELYKWALQHSSSPSLMMKAFTPFANKIDVYGVGMMCVTVWHYLKVPKSQIPLLKEIRSLILAMIQPDPRLRIAPADLLVAASALAGKWKM
jgi:serine/threonine protein kinase